MTVSARLVGLDGTELLRFGAISPTNTFEPFILTQLSLGWPDIRESSTPIPGRDGEFDTTTYHGASIIDMQLYIREDMPTNRDTLLDQLRGYCRPDFRAYLYIKKDGWNEERRAYVRGSAAPVTFSRPGALPVGVSWRAIDGAYESATLHTQTIFPSVASSGGVTFPLIYPTLFGAGTVTGSANITNNGTISSSPFIDIYGSCSNPIIKNLTTGLQLGFTGLTIQPGDFIRIDMKNKTALLTNDVGQSRYNLLDFVSSNWWSLPSGTSAIAFVPTNPGPSCQAIINWRDTTI